MLADGGDWSSISTRCRARLLLGLYVLQYETILGREADVKKGLLCGGTSVSLYYGCLCCMCENQPEIYHDDDDHDDELSSLV